MGATGEERRAGESLGARRVRAVVQEGRGRPVGLPIRAQEVQWRRDTGGRGRCFRFHPNDTVERDRDRP